MNTFKFEKHISQRAQRVAGSLGKQNSIPIPGLLHMGSGTPDFFPPEALFDAMREAVDSRRIQYVSWMGIPELRAAIAAKLKAENEVEYDPDSEIIVTAGAQQAVMVAMMTLLDPGDHALTPTPHYDEYTRDASILGSTVIPVPTTPESNFTITAADLEAAITPQTKALIIVTPNNPTATVLPEATLREIARLAQERDLMVISDEIYEYYVFDGHKHISLASLPGMRERTVTINSFSKSFAITGMRLGYIAAPAPVIAAMLPIHHALLICANAIAQYGALAALTQPRDWFKDVLKEYDRRRRMWMSALDAMGLGYSEPQGAYYIFIDVRSTGLTSAEFVRRARDEARLVFLPGTIGGGAGEGFVRGAFTRASPEFDEGLARMAEWVKTLG
jgi:aminotransferase